MANENPTNPLVKVAIEAMNATDAMLTDDGDAYDLTPWSDSELFGPDKAYLMSIDRVEDNGLTVYGKFHSDRWGEFDTFMKFTIQGGKIARLEVGQVSD